MSCYVLYQRRDKTIPYLTKILFYEQKCTELREFSLESLTLVHMVLQLENSASLEMNSQSEGSASKQC